jgi:hypothetical protein
VAISLISNSYEIASVVPLPRNDVATQSPSKGGGKESELKLIQDKKSVRMIQKKRRVQNV